MLFRHGGNAIIYDGNELNLHLYFVELRPFLNLVLINPTNLRDLVPLFTL